MNIKTGARLIGYLKTALEYAVEQKNVRKNAKKKFERHLYKALFRVKHISRRSTVSQNL